MAWTAFPTWVVGQVSLASDWNTYVANNMQFLATPPCCSVYRTAALTVSSAGGVLPFDTVLDDTASGFSLSTHLYTVPVAGRYWCYAQYILGASFTSGLYAQNAIQHNGSAIKIGGTPYPASSNAELTAAITGYVVCVVGDTLGDNFFTNTATPQTLSVGQANTFMDIVKVSN